MPKPAGGLRRPSLLSLDRHAVSHLSLTSPIAAAPSTAEAKQGPEA